uniref:Uncharacterized protein n=1 Tax=Quercus lobata TaxID=97700 RepID=A0A7N2LJM5_QUELO
MQHYLNELNHQMKQWKKRKVWIALQVIIQMRLHLLLNSRGKSQSCLLGPYPVFTKDGAIKEITNAEVQDLIWMVGNLKLEVTRYSRLLYKGSDQSVDDTRDANSSGSITAQRVSKRMRRPCY